MHINILLPHKEKFSNDLASSVSITIANNLKFSKFQNKIKIFGQHVTKPMFKKNFVGIKNKFSFFKSKNENLAENMCKIIKKTQMGMKIIEMHNRPYLVEKVYNNLDNKIIVLFVHNDPLEMKGSMTTTERIELLNMVDKIICVSNFIKKKFLIGIKKNREKVIVLFNGIQRSVEEFPLKKTGYFVEELLREKVYIYI